MDKDDLSTNDINELKQAAKFFNTHSLRLADNGATVHYREAQEGSTKACVILHGLTGTSYSMLLLADAYRRRGWRVVVPDLPGHGSSSAIPVKHMHDLADWLYAVLRQLCPEPTVLVGDSFGSSVALTYAQKYRLSPVTRLVLGAPIPTLDSVLKVVDRVFACTPDAAARRLYYTNRLLLGMRTNFLLAQRHRSDYRRLVEECIAIEGAQANHRYAEMVLMGANIDNNPFKIPLSEDLVGRTAVVYGDTDRLSGKRAARYLQEWAADAQVVEVPQCGHLVHIEGISAMLDASE